MSKGCCGRRCFLRAGAKTPAATAAAGPLGEVVAVGCCAGYRDETLAPAARWAAGAADLAGFWKSLCSFPPLCCRDVQVFCSVCPDPLSITFRLATTSLFSWRAGRVPMRHGDLYKPLGTTLPHPPVFLPGHSAVLRRVVGNIVSTSRVPPGPGNREVGKGQLQTFRHP